MKARIPSADSVSYNSSVLSRFKQLIKECSADYDEARAVYANTSYALTPTSMCAYKSYMMKFLREEEIDKGMSDERLKQIATAVLNGLKAALLLPFAFPASEDDLSYYITDNPKTGLVEFTNILHSNYWEILLETGEEIEAWDNILFDIVVQGTGFLPAMLTTCKPFANVSQLSERSYYTQVGKAMYLVYALTLLSYKTDAARNVVFAALTALEGLNPPTDKTQCINGWLRSCKLLECHCSEVETVLGKNGLARIIDAAPDDTPWNFEMEYSSFTKREKVELVYSADKNEVSVKEVNKLATKVDNFYVEMKAGVHAGIHTSVCATYETIPVLRSYRSSMHMSKALDGLMPARDSRSEVSGLKRTIRKLESQLAEARSSQPKEIVRTETVEVSSKKDKELIDSLRTKVSRLEERNKSLNEDLEALEVVQQDNEVLQRRIEELDALVKQLTAQEEEFSEESTFTDEELAILSTIKVHIDMPDCAAVNQLKSLMPRAKIDTDTLGVHGKVVLTPGYSVYCFCTKLSHAHFTSFSNQAGANGYTKCFANTCSATGICKTILKTYKEVNNHD